MKKQFLKYLPHLLIAGIAVFYFVRYRVAPSIEIKSIEVRDENGLTASLASHVEYPAVIHFYADWCGPCKKEMLELATFSRLLDSKGYNVYLLSDDQKEITDRWKSIFPKTSSFLSISSLEDLTIRTIPTTYIFDKSGEIVLKKVVPLEWNNPDFNNELDKFIQ